MSRLSTSTPQATRTPNDCVTGMKHAWASRGTATGCSVASLACWRATGLLRNFARAGRNCRGAASAGCSTERNMRHAMWRHSGCAVPLGNARPLNHVGIASDRAIGGVHDSGSYDCSLSATLAHVRRGASGRPHCKVIAGAMTPLIALFAAFPVLLHC